MNHVPGRTHPMSCFTCGSFWIGGEKLLLGPDEGFGRSTVSGHWKRIAALPVLSHAVGQVFFFLRPLESARGAT